jgi:voltage-gated potassium channel
MKSEANTVQAEEERWELLDNLAALLDLPLIVLGFVWLILVVVDLTSGLSSALLIATYVIWGLFIFDYLLGLVIAPNRIGYLRQRWLSLIALTVPALRVLAVLRAFRAVQSLRFLRAANLARVLSSTNRALVHLRVFLGQRQLGMVIASTVVVIFAGSAGIYALEDSNQAGDASIESYGDALWWGAMMMTTIGSDIWPQTAEGRVLAWLMAVYAFAVFGYITAFLASIFLASPADKSGSSAAPTERQ